MDVLVVFFFFKQKTAYEMRISDWSSDVCSSDLAQRGRASQGLSPAGIAYGYRKVLQFDDRGRAINGLREIDPETSAVVIRIFTEYAAGRSARQIAEDLTSDGIAPPSGEFWQVNTIAGSPTRHDGILPNYLYNGRSEDRSVGQERGSTCR